MSEDWPKRNMDSSLDSFNLEQDKVFEDSTLCYQKGEALANQNQYSTALAYFDRTIALQPDHCNAWVFRAVVLIHLQRYEEALESCDRALELQPLDSEAWLFRGVALQRLGRYSEAYADYQQALGDSAENTCADRQSGWTKWQQRFKQAWKAFRFSHLPL